MLRPFQRAPRAGGRSPGLLGLLCLASLFGPASGCGAPRPQVREAEAEALRNGPMGRPASLLVHPPVRVAPPDHVARCRRRGELFRVDGPWEQDAMTRELDRRRVALRRWASDAYPVRVELRCGAAQQLELAVSWYSPARGELLHGEQVDFPVTVPAERGRSPVTAARLRRALETRAGAWGAALVVHGD